MRESGSRGANFEKKSQASLGSFKLKLEIHISQEQIGVVGEWNEHPLITA